MVETLDPDWRVKRPSSGTFESEYFPRIDGYDDDRLNWSNLCRRGLTWQGSKNRDRKNSY